MYPLLDQICIYSLLFSSLVGIIGVVLGSNYSKNVKLLPFFILYLFCIESFAGYLTNSNQQNAWLYNYSSIIENSFLIWLVSSFYKQKQKNKIARLSVIVFSILSLINILFFQGKNGFHTITFGIGSLFLIITCIYFFYELFLYPSQTHLITSSEFWIVTGILFSFTCGFPIFCLNNFYSNKISEEIWPIITITNYIINIIYYSIFSIAFLCNIKIKKYS